MPTYKYSLNGQAAAESQAIELRTEEVQELLGQMPGWLIRWGITVVFSIVGLLILASWLVKYPDVLTSRVVLTTKTPPVSVVARTQGRIQFWVKDKERVQKGTYLAVIESPAAINDVRNLTGYLRQLKHQLKQAKATAITNVALPENLRLGELQESYLALLNSLQEYQRNHRTNLPAKQIQGIEQRIKGYEALNAQLENQQQLLLEELQLAQKRYTVDAKLLEEKVIADIDLDRTKNAYLQAKRAFESAQGQIINNQLVIAQLQSQVTEYQTNAADQEGRLRLNIETALKQLESRLDAWEEQYVFKAPIAGEIAFVKYWSNNQFINAGEGVFTIVPPSEDLFAQVQLPITGSGKVEPGQRVNIKFDNYPSPEYGMVKGTVQAISVIPQNNMYTIQIALPQGLTTSYRRKLPFRQEMPGTAEIITKDLRLSERIFHQFRALLDNPRS
ncbi:HlyD family secretion protein [Adhaeribacter rhizoryzae]|uniref:HlyD family efflux transporter periplasmic adaptor subunit n=1 Tax=Adhaeribacter rhizoryzae TaxID=2607907 RepID=A0A5M6D2A3_9BACT|nr:HlyD family efflux transporter periplasmic adaptor subunit [Adhaeribacter rhizoryzae]KAA5541581.1 HlyD family efflux transporter periplasmic adaptor subunit [Adhaeribacter rhizoryzae]